MFFRISLVVQAVAVLLASCISCMTSMNPSHPVYWLDSHINITCRVSLTNVKLEECSWFVNSQRITTGQMFVNQNRKECSIAVPAAIAQNGKWKCRVHPSSLTGIEWTEMTASTYVTILDVRSRECIIIICSAIVIVALSIIIARLAIKNRIEKSFNQRFQPFEPSAPELTINMENNNRRRNSTPPPTYDKVFNDDRSFSGEYSQLHMNIDNRFDCHSETHDEEVWKSASLQKTRSAPIIF